MQKKHRVLLWMILFPILFFGVERFCHKQTRGFQLYKILSKHDAEFPDLLPSLCENDLAQLRTIFNQPFYFFGSGGQCYAFISEDKKTVLKLFKNHHIRLWKFLNRIPLPQALARYRQTILHKNLHQSPAFFESCKISYLELKERTGLIYLHLHQTDYFERKLTIIDKLGIAHQIDLDSIDFALQKKAERTNPKLKKLIRENNLDAAKQCVESLLSLAVEKCQKGIRDRDPNFRRNIGFIDNRAIEIDLGSFSRDESLKNPENFKWELLDKTQKLKQWLGRRNQDLSLYLSNRIDQVLQENEK
jgi:hypothetical protein